MHRFSVPLDLTHRAADAHRDRSALLGPVTRVRDPQALFSNDSLAQALQQLDLYGRDGLPVIDTDARWVQGWLTNQNVLRAIGAYLAAAQPDIAASRQAAKWADPKAATAEHDPRSQLAGYRIVEHPWHPTRLPLAASSANWTGQPVTSPCPYSTTADSSRPTRPSGSARATGSTSSSPTSATATSTARPPTAATRRRPATPGNPTDTPTQNEATSVNRGTAWRSNASPATTATTPGPPIISCATPTTAKLHPGLFTIAMTPPHQPRFSSPGSAVRNWAVSANACDDLGVVRHRRGFSGQFLHFGGALIEDVLVVGVDIGRPHRLTRRRRRTVHCALCTPKRPTRLPTQRPGPHRAPHQRRGETGSLLEGHVLNLVDLGDKRSAGRQRLYHVARAVDPQQGHPGIVGARYRVHRER